MNNAAQILDPFVEQWAVLLTTYKRDGTPVGTAVNIVVEGDHAYFRTWDTAWKLKRIRNNPDRGRGRPVHTPRQANRAYGAGPRQGAGRQ